MQKSWWSRILGRSLLRAVIGDFFADKNNAASVIAIMLVATLCYVVAAQQKYEYANGLLNIVLWLLVITLALSERAVLVMMMRPNLALQRMASPLN
jgi:hypothetical protein